MRHLVKRIRLFREMFEHETQSRRRAIQAQSKRLPPRFNFRKGIRDKFDIAGKLIVQQLIISKGDILVQAAALSPSVGIHANGHAIDALTRLKKIITEQRHL